MKISKLKFRIEENNPDKTLSQEYKTKTLPSNLGENQLIYTNTESSIPLSQHKVFTPEDEEELYKKTMNIDLRK